MARYGQKQNTSYMSQEYDRETIKMMANATREQGQTTIDLVAHLTREINHGNGETAPLGKGILILVSQNVGRAYHCSLVESMILLHLKLNPKV